MPNRGFKHSEETKRKISQFKIGKKRTLEQRKNISLSHKGQTPWNKGKSGYRVAPRKIESRIKASQTMRNKLIGYIRKTDESKLARVSMEWKLWREAVFKRDNWICVWCGKKGGVLHPDHIKPFALFPELRFAIDNGRTLCVDCHKTTDTWGNSSHDRLGRFEKLTILI